MCVLLVGTYEKSETSYAVVSKKKKIFANFLDFDELSQQFELKGL